MRLLIVTNVFPPAIGGPATFSARLAGAALARGHAVRVVCGTPDGPGAPGHAFPVRRVGCRGNALRREASRRMVLLGEVARAERVYVMGLEHQAVWACRRLGKPYVLRLGGDGVWEAARNLGVTDLEPEAYYAATARADLHAVAIMESRRHAEIAGAAGLVPVSASMERLCAAWGVRMPGATRRIANGIDSPPIPPDPAGRPTGAPLELLYVGRQTNCKGVDAALLALARSPRARLTVIGSGPQATASADLARRLGLTDRATFRGDLSVHEVMAEMARRHILLLPSLYEGMSNTLLEAGAAGLACIASDRGGNPEVIRDGETGLLVDPWDVGALAAAIGRLEADDALRRRLASAHAARVARRFTLDRAAEETLAFLTEPGGGA